MEKQMESSVNYQQGLVTLIDILGFSQIINNKDAHGVLKILNQFGRVESSHRQKYMESYFIHKSYIFSDSIIRIRVPNADREYDIVGTLSMELSDLMYIQGLLYGMGILIRGGISFGQIFFNEDNIVFGEALIKSYKIESEESKYPRIILEDGLIKNSQILPLFDEIHDEENFAEYISTMLREDEDGKYYINYFDGLLEEMDDDISRVDYIRFSKHFIEENISRLSTAEKYLWLAKKHNDMINPLNALLLRNAGLERDDAFVNLKP